MSLLIPVTLVSTSEIKSSQRIDSQDHQKAHTLKFQDQSLRKEVNEIENPYQSELLPSSDLNINLPCDRPFNNINPLVDKMQSKYQNIEPSISCPKLKQKKTCEQELQKKSTRSSLLQESAKKSTSQSHQNSFNHLNNQKQVVDYQKNPHFQENLETQGDVLPQLICSCKICLQATNEPTYNPVDNPICKVCNCIDYVHIKCLEAWITRRDVVNEQIEPNQCEVCLAFYQVDLKLESFFSGEILCRHFKSDAKGMFCEMVPSLVFFVFAVVGIWVLGSLIADRKEEGGEIRAVLGMPYGTCITILIFLQFVLCLVFGIFLYSWMRQFLLDFKFKVKVLKGEKAQGNRLKKMFNNIR